MKRFLYKHTRLQYVDRLSRQVGTHRTDDVQVSTRRGGTYEAANHLFTARRTFVFLDLQFLHASDIRLRPVRADAFCGPDKRAPARNVSVDTSGIESGTFCSVDIVSDTSAVEIRLKPSV